MNPASASPNTTPYKGSESYQIEDAELFFGRENEADRLVARILSSRFTLLHAQSGAGKTSLLNARVIPKLETSGWAAIRVLPQNHPTESVRVTTLHHVMPAPSSELAALVRAWQLFDPEGDPPIHDFLERYDRLPVSAALRRDLLAPVEAPSIGVLPSAGRVRPLFLRILRGTLTVGDYREHVNAVRQAGGCRQSVSLGESSRLSEWRDALADCELKEAHEIVLSNLYGPDPDLRLFFESIFHWYGSFAPRFCLVLILDQFEELFTRFVDSAADSTGGANQPDWRMRWEFLGQLERLTTERVMMGTASGTASVAPLPLPMRIVVSMRDEYIAQMDPVRRFVPELDASAFHLSYLEKDEALSAIVEPARKFGVAIDEISFRNIAAELTREDRYVEPAQLQIVCEKLWSDHAAGLNGSSKTIRVEEGRTKSILATFFKEFLDSIGPPGDLNRLEALEILEPLVTSSRTRNIVERECLITSPFCFRERRERLIEQMVRRMIVRVETRLGGRFAEITHEFLITPVLDSIRFELNANADYGRFRWAIRTIERFDDVDLHDARQALLGADVHHTLHQHRERVAWTDFATELMFRSALRLGASREILLEWARRFSETGVVTSVEDILCINRMLDPARAMMSPEELQIVWRAREESPLDANQVLFVLRNVMMRESPREQIAHWMKRLMEP